ncbi:MAG: FHA domain-containing protein [Chloroflexi bacterium]|nr:MAG: FHA domain-containing protein [Chloroflexota bacterium]
MQNILSEYQQLRDAGMTKKAAYRALHALIEPLSPVARHELKKQLRRLEAQREAQLNLQPAVPQPRQQNDSRYSHPAIRRLSPEMLQNDNDTPAISQPNEDKAPCPNCGRMNHIDAPLCYFCGQLIGSIASLYGTRSFDENEPDESTFCNNMTLVLQVRGSSFMVQKRAQDMSREMIIGRTAENTKLVPDIDLADADAEAYGVSRLHTALSYVPENNTLQISDLNSANGTYLNGQKLHPKEVRVLRHGDELRIGKLYLDVLFLE